MANKEEDLHDYTALKKYKDALRELQEKIRLDGELATPMYALFGEISAIVLKNKLKFNIDLEEEKQDLIKQLAKEYKENKSLNEEKMKDLGFKQEHTSKIQEYVEAMEEGKLFEKVVENTKKGLDVSKKIKSALDGGASEVVELSLDVLEQKSKEKEAVEDEIELIDETIELSLNTEPSKNKNRQRSRQ